MLVANGATKGCAHHTFTQLLQKASLLPTNQLMVIALRPHHKSLLLLKLGLHDHTAAPQL